MSFHIRIALTAVALLLAGCGSKFEKLSGSFAEGVKSAVMTGKADASVGRLAPTVNKGRKPDDLKKLTTGLGKDVKVLAALWQLGGRPAGGTQFWRADAVVLPDGKIAYKDFVVFGGVGESDSGPPSFPLRDSAPEALRNQVEAVRANLAGPCDLPLITRAELQAAGLRGLDLPPEKMVPSLEERRKKACALVKSMGPTSPLVGFQAVLGGSGGTLTVFTQLEHEPFSIAQWNAYIIEK